VLAKAGIPSLLLPDGVIHVPVSQVERAREVLAVRLGDRDRPGRAGTLPGDLAIGVCLVVPAVALTRLAGSGTTSPLVYGALVLLFALAAPRAWRRLKELRRR
jgi:hypothetical protein